jgi:hypothetical protein
MMDQMRKIIRHQETKSDGLSRADAANDVQLTGWQVGYYMGEIPIVSGPQRPIGVLNGLHADVSDLIVSGEIQGRLKSRPDESLVVV